MYSQFRIENVQVAQIVCVVGWAEPGQHQQQQSLHGQCLVLLFFPAFFSSLYTEALSSFVHPISPSAFSTSNSPNPSVLTPPHSSPLLPSYSRDADQNYFYTSYLLSLFSFLPALPVCLYELDSLLPGHLSCRGKRAKCQRLKTEWKRWKKKQEQVQKRTPVITEEEEEKV